VCQQLRALAVLHTAQARKKGYPYRVPFPEFIRRYGRKEALEIVIVCFRIR